MSSCIMMGEGFWSVKSLVFAELMLRATQKCNDAVITKLLTYAVEVACLNIEEHEGELARLPACIRAAAIEWINEALSEDPSDPCGLAAHLQDLVNQLDEFAKEHAIDVESLDMKTGQ